MVLYNLITGHWEEIILIWLSTIKVLTAIQDSVDAKPLGLKPPFGEVLYYMKALSGFLVLGNRPQSIGGSNVQVISQGSTSSSSNASSPTSSS